MNLEDAIGELEDFAQTVLAYVALAAVLASLVGVIYFVVWLAK